MEYQHSEGIIIVVCGYSRLDFNEFNNKKRFVANESGQHNDQLFAIIF